MQKIQLKNISKSYGDESIIENLHLEVPAGSFFVLLGPSGSGKTTLLRMIAGFEKPDQGHVVVGGRNITDIPAHERKINTVFQQYALFPHLNVFDNVAYGLRIKSVPEDEIKQRVHKVLKAVRLEKQMYRSIAQLSGGQKQRVALARAVINRPDVLLFDEPLAALDPKLREAMMVELMELQETLKTTFVYVTHDQTEALTVADTMAIMNQDGQVEQVGTPEEIYEFPVSSFVARFVGRTNLFPGTLHIEGETATLDVPYVGSFMVMLPKDAPWAYDSAHVLLSVRPEKIRISKKQHEGFSNQLEGVVDAIIYHGRSTQYNVRLANDMIVRVFEQNEKHFPTDDIDDDDRVYLYWQKENGVLLKQ